MKLNELIRPMDCMHDLYASVDSITGFNECMVSMNGLHAHMD